MTETRAPYYAKGKVPKPCPKCKSENISIKAYPSFNPEHPLWRCDTCNNEWPATKEEAVAYDKATGQGLYPDPITVTIEETVKAQTIVQEAIINLLEKKGLLTKTELLAEIQRIKALLDNPNRN